MPGGVTITRNNVEKVFRQVELGTMRALNRGMATARTQAVRAVAENVGVLQTLVRDRIVLEKATLGKLETTLRFTGKRFRQIDLIPSRRAKVPGEFLATMRSGHMGLFVRTSPSRSRKGRPRSSPELPIREVYAVSVPVAATRAHILESTLSAAEEAFTKNQAHEVSFATSGGA